MRSLVLTLLFLAPAASAVAIEWLPVGDPGHANYPLTDYGGVAYSFEIAWLEVSNAEYAGFLSAVAEQSDPNDLWNANMGTNALGGIEREGLPGSYVYTLRPDMANKPVNYVSFWDAVRFVNWLHNDTPIGIQDSTTTEDGAYTLTAQTIADNSVTRNPDARFGVPTRNEWIKAAYYDGNTQSYYLSPAQSQSVMNFGAPGDDDGNTCNCHRGIGVLEDGGSYALSVSPWGTYDQGGNVEEWIDFIIATDREWLGSSYGGGEAFATVTAVTRRVNPGQEIINLGFRVVKLGSMPVPLLGPLAAIGLIGAVLVTGLVAARRFPSGSIGGGQAESSDPPPGLVRVLC